MNENETTPSPEELQSEQESLAELKDDELRTSVVSSLGLEDNDANKELIEKIVGMKKADHGKLSKAISQKIKFRTMATTSKPDQQTTGNLDADGIRKQTETQLSDRFNEEYLEDSDFSDNLKTEIRKISKLNNVSARKATKDPYIMHLIEQEKAAKRAAEAATNGNGNGRNGQDDGGSMPAKFNDPAYMITEEGQKDYDTWSKSRK